MFYGFLNKKQIWARISETTVTLLNGNFITGGIQTGLVITNADVTPYVYEALVLLLLKFGFLLLLYF